MRKTGVYTITILAILISSTLIQWTALSTPTLIQPQATIDVGCWEGKRCTDQTYYDCVSNCYAKFWESFPSYCVDCTVLIISTTVLSIGATYWVFKSTGSLLFKILVLAGIRAATWIAVKVSGLCDDCYELILDTIDCVEDCPCPEWEEVWICP